MKKMFCLLMLAFTFVTNAQNKFYTDNIISDIKSESYKNDFIIKNFPIGNTLLKDITFHKMKPIIDDKTIIVVDNKFKINTPKFDRFFGKSIDNDDVFVTLIDDKMYCFIKSINGEKYVISPDDNYSNNMVINANKPVQCNSIEPNNLGDIENKYKGERLLSNNKLQVNIAIDVCKEWYLYKFKNDNIN